MRGFSGIRRKVIDALIAVATIHMLSSPAANKLRSVQLTS